MAYNDDQQEYPVPGGDNTRRTSAQHLPRYFRTEANKKFLSATLDQLLKPGTAEKINGFVGRKYAKAFDQNDNYVEETLKQRSDYQFEPVSVIKDDLRNVEFYADYNDYINQIQHLGGNTDNHSILNRQEYYSWNPHIDWDKFVNFREYYWLPNGPQPVPVAGESVEVETEYSVTNEDNLDNRGFVFTPDGVTQNPELVLYRGITYRFDIDSPELPISFRSNRIIAQPWSANTFYRLGSTALYEGQIYTVNRQHRSSDNFEEDREFWDLNTEFNLTNEVSEQNVSQGTVEIILNQQTPDFIYYVSDLDANAGGLIRVYDIEEAAFVEVEREILGKKTYRSGNGVDLSNGMKIYFQGTTNPDFYETGNFYVEGVGDRIQLIPEQELTLASAFVENEQIAFDTEGFDSIPFSTAIGFPREKDYVTINRSSDNGNLWSKYNRWFHREIIEKAAEINGTALDLDQSARAKRPIIEFEPNLKLINFGTEAKRAVDLVDDFTRDVFSTIEGSEGYNIDGIDVSEGMRLLFLAEPDQRVNGKIFEVKFVNFKGNRQISLIEPQDSEPLENQTVLCGQGNDYSGEIFYYDGSRWQPGQNKVSTNQQPLFELYNCDEDSLADPEVYQSTTFEGTAIFSYRENENAPPDRELGIPISYRSIANVGDIEFEFDLLTDGITYCPEGDVTIQEKTGIGYLRNYVSRTDYRVENGWQKAEQLSDQPVIRQYVADTGDREFEIDVFENSANVDDLKYRVYLNNDIQVEGSAYTTDTTRSGNLKIVFNRDLFSGDIVLIKARSRSPKNDNGFYEIPINLERNPLNGDLDIITLGEINDHVQSIIESVEDFQGEYPGRSNLRDQGKVTQYGRRIVKHSVPYNLPLYHLVDESANVIKSIDYAAREYTKFKRRFIQIANDLSFAGDTRDHVEAILREQFRDNSQSDPFFASDMIPLGGAKVSRFEVTSDQQVFYALNQPFTLEYLSDKAVLVYLNDVQLVVDRDYEFNSEGFIEVTAALARGDVLEVYEYENTNGSFVPPTPTKLGIYPRFTPAKYVDDTYFEPREVIRGHDGSIILAYGDFRDDLLLDIEKRIYNNIKVKYDTELFDIFDYVPSVGRTTDLTRTDIDSAILPDFIRYLRLIDEDYTENKYFDRENSFTYNYAGSRNFQGETVRGWWRAIYQNAYDTDSPHTRPWEMLGFVDKPAWWEEQYGPAPYTNNNLILWEDLEQGVVRQPGQRYEIYDKFRRPELSSHIPVDDQGNLLSPLESGYIKFLNFQTASNKFEYGDWSPVETAWRKNSDYPFKLIKSFILNQPNRVFATAFDRSRQIRGLVGDIIYQDPNIQLRTDNIVFPDEVDSGVFASGLVNWVKEYVQNVQLLTYNRYQEKITTINNQMGFKIGGFTSKEKFNLVLDSRTPTNEGNVFVPPENYQIFVNKTTPIRQLYYSGVIVEKRARGFLIRGYNTEQPFFFYDPVVVQNSLTPITVGGISQPAVTWTPERTLVKGTVVVRSGKVYRATETHTTTNQFEQNKFAQLPNIPVVGGRSAIFNTKFENEEKMLPYNTILDTVQEVVDFILGYNNWLQRQGFRFDYFDREEGKVDDWNTAAKEFLFWTTQNWAEGSVLSVSPGAERFSFVSETEAIDDIYDTFYGYSLVKVDGKKLQPELVSVTREAPSEFQIRTKDTADGIYGVRISTVQKEHAVLLDDRTVFNDIIFDKQPGFRQERIKVVGYRSGEWNGSFNIPGFTYDNATVTEWQPWRDYAIGDLVRFKEFFYAARTRIPGAASFDTQNWVPLESKPEPELIPNWDYKSNQFADFYDLDSDNFDEEQQKFAQHLIGYQNRTYLANIINDDVSQYKFYQGFIQDKGSRNALDKLFDVLSGTDRESLDFFEEWAVKAGSYGSTKGFEEVEFRLDERKFKTKPQPVELVDRLPSAPIDLVYRIEPSEVYQKPENYDHAPFPEKSVFDTFTKTSGYVNPDDINFEVAAYDDILDLDVSQIFDGDVIWVGNVNNDWNVYTALTLKQDLKQIDTEDNLAVTFSKTVKKNLQAREIVGIFNAGAANGFYRINAVNKNTVELENPNDVQIDDPITDAVFVILTPSRFESIDDANNQIDRIKSGLDRIWIDDFAGTNWRVIDKASPVKQHQTVQERTDISDQYGASIETNYNNTVVVLGAPREANGAVYIYIRNGENNDLKLAQKIEANADLAKAYPVFDADSTAYETGDIVKRFNKHYQAKREITPGGEFDPADWEEVEPNDIQQFGTSVAVDRSGDYIAIGAPGASDVKTFFQGDYEETRNYDAGSIVRFQDRLWSATTPITGAVQSIEFGSFESVPQILQDLGLVSETSEKIYTILAGNYPFTDVTTDHFIVKAPRDMYEGSDIGDTVDLQWNKTSYAYQDQDSLSETAPFAGTIGLFDENFLSQQFVIGEKIDSILYVDASTNIPDIGQIVETPSGFGEVAYTYSEVASVTIYIKNQNGTFGLSGSLFTEIGEFVGEYETQAPVAQTPGVDDYWGGYWRINLNETYQVSETNRDEGRGLVYADLLTDSFPHGFYYNIFDYASDDFSSFDTRFSEVTTLTYRGLPGPLGEVADFDSRLYVLRAPADLTGNVGEPLDPNGLEITAGDEIEIFYNTLPNFQTGDFLDPQTIGLTREEINRRHTVFDVWDGYIDITLTIADPLSDRFREPRQGLTVRPVDFPNAGTAVIAFYQKFDTDSVRLYLKDLEGNWPAGAEFGENREIEWLEEEGETDPPYNATQTFGQIQSRSIGYAPDSIGRMIVLEADTVIPVTDQSRILDAEYWFYKEETVQGIPREPNIPSIDNNDWLETNRISASTAGTASNLSQEGLFAIYERNGVSNWSEVDTFIVPDRKQEARLGSGLQFSQINELTRLFVESQGNSTVGNKGRIYIIKNGVEDENDYSWELGSNKQYKGEYSASRVYAENDVVFYEGDLYQAVTNIVAGGFDTNDWALLDIFEEPFDYLGFIPNDTGLVIDPDAVLDQTGLVTFSQNFDASENGEVIVVSSRFDSETENTVVVYRNIRGFYEKSQTIEAPNTNSGFGESISVSDDGKKIAVGMPYDDTNLLDQGAVYIYQEIQTQFELVQILYSTDQSRAELFGLKVDWDSDTLAVTAKNSASSIETQFDSGKTVFDSEFTDFVDERENSGTVLLFKDYGNALLYSQTIDFDEDGVRYFGRQLLVNENHVYVPLPSYSESGATGVLVDYRRDQSQDFWQTVRQIKPTVDISKIKQVKLYDIKQNQLIEQLDFVDPLQGKIPGIAEREISFKTYYDPATYTAGSGVKINTTNSWNHSQVGKVWWDLSNAKFRNPYQGSTVFSANNWNSVFSQERNAIDVYEWVESDVLPSRWDEISGTEEGFSRGISGSSKYGNDGYVEKQLFDSASKTFSTKYYFWVKGKLTRPAISTRQLNVQDIADLIQDPKAEGYRFIQLISPTEFALVNCDDLISSDDVALSVQYWTIDDQSINVHNEYQILTEGLDSSRPNEKVEQKWFDSLVGYDTRRRAVPALELSEKEKYGVLDDPRQGWFVNRVEALKQTVERINRVLKENLIADNRDISRLTEFEPEPLIQSRLYDTVVETVTDLEFIGVSRARPARLQPEIQNGRIVDVEIVDSGRGYQNPPTIEIAGTGTGAELLAEINSRGQVESITIRNSGEYYSENTIVSVRNFAALVQNDEEIGGRWAVYERNPDSNEWQRTVSQGYNVNLYWDYEDWYEEGYSSATEIDTVISSSYELSGVQDEIGDTVKIENVGTGGWLLLEKIDNQANVDFTVNYKTIGRQNGTIQLSNLLYDIAANLVSYDVGGFDSKFYDSLPTVETRIILETVRDDIFTDDLAIEYNRLFFANIRYVLAEQKYVDWVFKTSFVKAQHNVGELEQKLTFRNDNLPNYQEYVEEVKPYKTKLREYLSSYEGQDNSRSVVTDFDLPPRYVETENRIRPFQTRLADSVIDIRDAVELEYPNRFWLENTGFVVQDILIADAGIGYTSAPIIEIVGGAGSGASAIASIGRDGILTSITVTNTGSGYISPPEVRINGSIQEEGQLGRAVAVLGGSPVRSITTGVKFDRVSGDFEFTTLVTEESFVGSGNQRNFDLKWPMDLRTPLVSVIVDGTEVLGGQYSYQNNRDVSKGYERFLGEIIFREAPAEGAPITVRYSKNIDILNAQDRINLSYESGEAALGKSLGQLMDGIDYGGVEVKSFGFASTSGWDAQPWFSQSWDVFDTEFEDYIISEKLVNLEFEDAVSVPLNSQIFQDSTGATGRVVEIIDEKNVVLASPIPSQFNTKDQLRLDDSSLIGEDSTQHVPERVYQETLVLDKPLDENVNYNVYKISRTEEGTLVSNVRLDDPDYGTASATNPEAVCETLEGDGSTEIATSRINLSQLSFGEEEQVVSIIIRKETSDGSFIPDPESYDTAISGGDLAYDTAKGIKAEDINIDGDGFVTAKRAKGPEEIVPGQVLDTVDIQVYERPAAGASRIESRNYIGNGITFVYDIGVTPVKSENVFVKINNTFEDNFDIDYETDRVILHTVPQEGDRINILNLGNAGLEILEIADFIGDGETREFLLNASYEQNLDSFVTVNGTTTNVSIVESDDTYENAGRVLITFEQPPAQDSKINILVTLGGDNFVNYSQVSIDRFTADGSTTQFILDNNIFAQPPALANTVVRVNNTVLNAGYSEVFEVTAARQYQINLTQVPIGSANSNEIEVYLNGIQLRFLQEWRFTGSAPGQGDESVGSIVELERGIGQPGDELKIYVIGDSEYRFGFFDDAGEFVPQRGEDSSFPVLNLDSAYSPGDEIVVYSFSNHDGQGIERQSVDVIEKTETTPGTERYYEYRQLTRGVIELRKTAIDAEYVWVVQNGDLLMPSVDYSVTEDGKFVTLVTPPKENDEIEVIHFANELTRDTFGWRQFKDMLNRVHYKRLNETVQLAQDLNWYDKTIEIQDNSSLPEPAFNSPNPGVVFIEGERIEYFVKDGNSLKQIRRGTLGTAVKDAYPAGTPVMEQGVSHDLPYRDKEQVVKVTAGGYSEGLSEYENSFGVSINDVVYDFNNNTAFPLGGQIATVTGTGFRSNAIAFVGETECETSYIDENTIEFITPALPVGSYDLVIVNPAIEEPEEQPRTSAVKQDAITYVQVLLPYSPSPETEIVDNPAADGDWYRAPFEEGGIPQDYWQALDIEVFVAGKRLQKAPRSVYAFEAQDSPEGDIEIQAEFAVNKDIGAYVRLSAPPPKGAEIVIIRKTLTEWTDTGTRLARSNTEVAKFLRDGSTELPR